MFTFYAHSVAGVALACFYCAALLLANAAAWAVAGHADDGAPGTIAGAAGLALTGLIMWAVHWRWSRRARRARPGSFAAVFHEIYLWTVVCLAAFATLGS